MGNEQVFVATPIRTAGQRIIASPFEFFSTGEDNIRILGLNTVSNVTLQIQGRTVDEKGTILPLRETLNLTANRVAASKDIPLGVGAMLNLVVFVSGATPLIGQTFVIAQLIRGMGTAALVLGTLCADYVTSTQPIAWPGSGVKSSIEGGGYIRVVVGTQPGAGIEVIETVPAGARWEPLAFDAVLTTGGAAGTRQPALFIDDGVGQYAASVNPQVIGAGQNIHFNWSPGMPITTAFAGFLGLAGLPVGLTLLAGHRIRTNTAALAAGDQWSAPRFAVREWLEAS